MRFDSGFLIYAATGKQNQTFDGLFVEDLHHSEFYLRFQGCTPQGTGYWLAPNHDFGKVGFLHARHELSSSPKYLASQTPRGSFRYRSLRVPWRLLVTAFGQLCDRRYAFELRSCEMIGALKSLVAAAAIFLPTALNAQNQVIEIANQQLANSVFATVQDQAGHPGTGDSR